MINQLKPYIFISLLVFNCSAFSHILETKNSLTIASGIGTMSGGENSLYFPSGLEIYGLPFDLQYNRTILNWLDVGIAFSYLSFNDQTIIDGTFRTLTLNDNQICMAGPQINFKTPFKATGICNRFSIGIKIAPLYSAISGTRLVKIDNLIVTENDEIQKMPIHKLDMNQKGISLKFTPEINYQLNSRYGLQVSASKTFIKLNTNYKENIVMQNINIGLIYRFGYHNLLF